MKPGILNLSRVCRFQMGTSPVVEGT